MTPKPIQTLYYDERDCRKSTIGSAFTQTGDYVESDPQELQTIWLKSERAWTRPARPRASAVD